RSRTPTPGEAVLLCSWDRVGFGAYKIARARGQRPRARPSCSRSGLLRQIQLDIRQVDFSAAFEGCIRVGDFVPAAASLAVPAGRVLHLTLALDASRAVRQGVQTSHGDFALTVFAQTISAPLDLGQRPLDLA